MQQLILVVHVLAAIAIVALVLVQHGKGADVGAAFGAGASNTMFGSQGSTSFLMKVTALCAAIFFATSLSLGYLNSRAVKSNGILNLPDTVPVKSTQIMPKPLTAPQPSGSADSFTPTLPSSNSKKQ